MRRLSDNEIGTIVADAHRTLSHLQGSLQEIKGVINDLEREYLTRRVEEVIHSEGWKNAKVPFEQDNPRRLI